MDISRPRPRALRPPVLLDDGTRWSLTMRGEEALAARAGAFGPVADEPAGTLDENLWESH